MTAELIDIIHKIYDEIEANADEYARIAKREARQDYDTASYYRGKADGLYGANAIMMVLLDDMGVIDISKKEN